MIVKRIQLLSDLRSRPVLQHQIEPSRQSMRQIRCRNDPAVFDLRQVGHRAKAVRYTFLRPTFRLPCLPQQDRKVRTVILFLFVFLSFKIPLIVLSYQKRPQHPRSIFKTYSYVEKDSFSTTGRIDSNGLAELRIIPALCGLIGHRKTVSPSCSHHS